MYTSKKTSSTSGSRAAGVPKGKITAQGPPPPRKVAETAKPRRGAQPLPAAKETDVSTSSISAASSTDSAAEWTSFIMPTLAAHVAAPRVRSPITSTTASVSETTSGLSELSYVTTSRFRTAGKTTTPAPKATLAARPQAAVPASRKPRTDSGSVVSRLSRGTSREASQASAASDVSESCWSQLSCDSISAANTTRAASTSTSDISSVSESDWSQLSCGTSVASVTSSRSTKTSSGSQSGLSQLSKGSSKPAKTSSRSAVAPKAASKNDSILSGEEWTSFTALQSVSRKSVQATKPVSRAASRTDSVLSGEEWTSFTALQSVSHKSVQATKPISRSPVASRVASVESAEGWTSFSLADIPKSAKSTPAVLVKAAKPTPAVLPKAAKPTKVVARSPVASRATAVESAKGQTGSSSAAVRKIATPKVPASRKVATPAKVPARPVVASGAASVESAEGWTSFCLADIPKIAAPAKAPARSVAAWRAASVESAEGWTSFWSADIPKFATTTRAPVRSPAASRADSVESAEEWTDSSVLASRKPVPASKPTQRSLVASRATSVESAEGWTDFSMEKAPVKANAAPVEVELPRAQSHDPTAPMCVPPPCDDESSFDLSEFHRELAEISRVRRTNQSPCRSEDWNAAHQEWADFSGIYGTVPSTDRVRIPPVRAERTRREDHPILLLMDQEKLFARTAKNLRLHQKFEEEEPVKKIAPGPESLSSEQACRERRERIMKYGRKGKTALPSRN